jgi:hypothetical protein
MASKYGYALGAMGTKIHEDHFKHIKNTLAFNVDPASKRKRDELWNGFDINGNGLLSLAEVDKGLRDVLQLGDNLFRAKKAIIRAFTKAKGAVPKKRTYSADYVDRCEFRLLLKYLWEYFLLYNAFMALEEDGDLRLSKEEFVANKHLIEGIIGPVTDVDNDWKKMKPGPNGHVLFENFCNWALDRDQGGEIDEE